MKPNLQAKEPPEKNPLVLIISSLKNVASSDERRRLQEKFYLFFIKKFFSRCHMITYRIYGKSKDWEPMRDDLVHDTFLLAFEKIEDFKINDDWNDEECEKVVLFWLSRIANNILIKQKNNEIENQGHLSQYKYSLITDALIGETTKRNYKPTFDREKFEKIWEKYSPKKRAVILSCAEYDTLEEENTKHLPDDEMLRLKKEFNLESANIRKIKERAIKDLKSCLIEK